MLLGAEEGNILLSPFEVAAVGFVLSRHAFLESNWLSPAGRAGGSWRSRITCAHLEHETPASSFHCWSVFLLWLNVCWGFLKKYPFYFYFNNPER